jgi:hypothetical protein
MTPETTTTLYLYGGIMKFTVADKYTPPFVQVQVPEAAFSLACWDVDTLRQFAEVCNDAADELEFAKINASVAATDVA